MSGRRSRNKGKVGELELANRLKEHGFSARRTAQYCGAAGDSDVLCDELEDFHLEVKRVERFQLYKSLEQAEEDSCGKIPVVMHRQSRKPWVVVMKLDDFLEKFYAPTTDTADTDST